MPETEAERLAREARENSGGGDRSGGRRYATPEEIAAQVTTLMARNNNDSQRVITQLMNDNRTARDKLRVAREKVVELEGKLPKDSIVLVGDDAKAYTAFKALNLKPDEVKTRIELATKLEAEKQTTERNGALKEAAKLLGYNEALFVELVNDKKLHVEMRDALVEGKQVKAPYIRPADKADAPLLAAKEYVDANLKGYVPALTAAPVTVGGSGTGFPNQSGGSSTAAPADTTHANNGGAPNAPKPIPGAQKFLTPSEARAAQKQS